MRDSVVNLFLAYVAEFAKSVENTGGDVSDDIAEERARQLALDFVTANHADGLVMIGGGSFFSSVPAYKRQ
jgi:hypothetical protein